MKNKLNFIESIAVTVIIELGVYWVFTVILNK